MFPTEDLPDPRDVLVPVVRGKHLVGLQVGLPHPRVGRVQDAGTVHNHVIEHLLMPRHSGFVVLDLPHVGIVAVPLPLGVQALQVRASDGTVLRSGRWIQDPAAQAGKADS